LTVFVDDVDAHYKRTKSSAPKFWKISTRLAMAEGIAKFGHFCIIPFCFSDRPRFAQPLQDRRIPLLKQGD
jgi:hypothetical protein